MVDRDGTSGSRLGDLAWALLLAYVLALPVQTLLDLPVTGSKLQVPELIFLPLAVAGGLFVLRTHALRPLRLADLIGAIWVTVVGISCAANGLDLGLFLEFAGVVYLALLAGLAVRLADSPNRVDGLCRGIVLGACLAGALGIAGFVLATVGVQTPLAWSPEPYPYFGRIGRAQALTTNPNMLASILTAGICVQLGRWHDRRTGGAGGWGPLALMGVAFLCTLSKSGLNLLIAVGVMGWGLERHRLPRAAGTALVCLCLLFCATFQFVTHVYVDNGNVATRQRLIERAFIAERPVANVHGRDWYPTSYLVNKRTAWQAFREHPLRGVGPGQYNWFVSLERRRGDYPANFPDYDPHSTYVGALAELGLGGLLAVGVVFALLCRAAVTVLRQRPGTGLPWALAGCLAAYTSEAVVTDMANFRHVWLLLALAAALASTPGRK